MNRGGLLFDCYDSVEWNFNVCVQYFHYGASLWMLDVELIKKSSLLKVL